MAPWLSPSHRFRRRLTIWPVSLRFAAMGEVSDNLYLLSTENLYLAVVFLRRRCADAKKPALGGLGGVWAANYFSQPTARKNVGKAGKSWAKTMAPTAHLVL